MECCTLHHLRLAVGHAMGAPSSHMGPAGLDAQFEQMFGGQAAHDRAQFDQFEEAFQDIQQHGGQPGARHMPPVHGMPFTGTQGPLALTPSLRVRHSIRGVVLLLVLGARLFNLTKKA